ncbi:MAG: hypothetical protein GY830_07260 [Bacteroidetes bacterium]|nr:hypothetical protein [Bacteroidota bacterium]
MIELINVKYSEEIAKHCLMNIHNKDVHSIHMCNDGNIRLPCALGEKVNCLDCRSVTTLALHAGMLLKDRQSLHALLRMYHSKIHS